MYFAISRQFRFVLVVMYGYNIKPNRKFYYLIKLYIVKKYLQVLALSPGFGVIEGDRRSRASLSILNQNNNDGAKTGHG
jgi:hypothetical protein